ncbi:MAG TPA: VWA domain-containing protein [Terriglobia bacterium]|nr:VWA domain-containing protein [Terriglobia bacterium]
MAILCFLIVLLGIAWPQKLPGVQDPKADPYTIKVDVNMVVLHATVENHKGVLVSGLSQSDFQVYEDGAQQEIKNFSHEDIPVTVGLVIDNSGSMAPKRQEVITAALAFAHSSNPQDQMFVISFNEHVRFGLPANTLFTDQVGQLQIALSGMVADGETALYDAVAAALEHLKKGNRDKKVLIVVSDGADNASKHRLKEVMATAVQSEAIIYALGLYDPDDPDRNPGVLKELARATGGEAFMPESIREIIPICERVARDIRNQYTIAYTPANRKQDGAYRVIQVKVGAPGHGRLLVRTRAGYYAPVKSQANAGSHP